MMHFRLNTTGLKFEDSALWAYGAEGQLLRIRYSDQLRARLCSVSEPKAPFVRFEFYFPEEDLAFCPAVLGCSRCRAALAKTIELMREREGGSTAWGDLSKAFLFMQERAGGPWTCEEDVSVLHKGMVLEQGSHKRREDGMNVMEAVAWISGSLHDSVPWCVDPVLTLTCLGFNDGLDMEDRQRLLPLVPLLVDTHQGRLTSKRRALFIINRVKNTVLAAFLRELPGTPRPDLADWFEGPIITDAKSAKQAHAELRSSPICDDLHRAEESLRQARPLPISRTDSFTSTMKILRTVVFVADLVSTTVDDSLAEAAVDRLAFRSGTIAEYFETLIGIACGAAVRSSSGVESDTDNAWKAVRNRVRDRMTDVLYEAVKLTG